MTNYNFHTHTYHCKHALGAPKDYCQAALAKGLTALGFSDHAPHPDGKWDAVRMDISELDTYFQEIHQCQALFPRLHIHPGLECEYRPDLGDFQKDNFLQTPGRCEYMALAIHDFINLQGEWTSSWRLHDTRQYLEYARFAVQGMSSGLYKFVVHPDLFFVGGGAWDDNAALASKLIAEAASALNIPLEINASGAHRPLITDLGGKIRRPFPHLNFWEVVAHYEVRVVISVDAHRPDDLGDVSDAEALARYFDFHVVTEEELFGQPN